MSGQFTGLTDVASAPIVVDSQLEAVRKSVWDVNLKVTRARELDLSRRFDTYASIGLKGSERRYNGVHPRRA